MGGPWDSVSAFRGSPLGGEGVLRWCRVVVDVKDVIIAIFPESEDHVECPLDDVGSP